LLICIDCVRLETMKLIANRKDFVLLSLILITSILLGVTLAFATSSYLPNFESKQLLSFDSSLTKNLTPNFPSDTKNSENTILSSVTSSSSIVYEMKIPPQPLKPKTEVAARDYIGQKITNYLKSFGYNLGYIWSTDLNKVDHKMPINTDINKEELDKKPTQPKNISEIIAKPLTCDRKNWFSFPKYNSDSPLNYASFQDMYYPDKNNFINLNNPIQESQAAINAGNYLSVPIQKLLIKGIVHLPESPHPGQVGNSYIVGHTSNFSQVRSDFNFVFKPFERKSQVGDEFFIWDSECRKMKFKVFEVVNILAEDINTAYKNYGDKRVVTLQGSILDANWQPTRRWLTRGELVVE
jgi:hypothetical protein